jgi:hypothetical protein
MVTIVAPAGRGSGLGTPFMMFSLKKQKGHHPCG